MENEKNIEDSIALIREASDRILRIWGLKWTFKSLDYILNTERVSLMQCAQAYFNNSSLTGESAATDIIRAVKVLLMAGLIGANDNISIDEAEEKAYEIMEAWRSAISDMNILHLLIIEKLREDHFFSEDLPVGLRLVEVVMKNAS